MVQQLADYPRDGYFVLERIGRFGEAAIARLRALATATTNPEVLTLATLGLAHFKDASQSDVDVLTRAIRTRSEYEHLACRALTHLGAASAGPVLIAELLATEPGEHERITSLVRAIRRFGIEITSDEVHRLTPPGAPPWIKALFNAGKNEP